MAQPIQQGLRDVPQRFLRPTITNSRRWNACSFPAQSLFIRILTLVDDFGRYDGRIPILHGHCFALRSDINPQETAALRSELQANGVIEVYGVDGKEFIQVLEWQERPRSEKSKFPNPVNIPQDSAAERSKPQEKDASLAITSSVIATTSSPSIPANKPSIPPTVPQGGQEGEIGFDEGKQLLNQLFGRKKRTWSCEEDQLLSQAVPISREDWLLIKTWFGLPLDHAVFEVTKRKHELTTFLRDFNGELDKIRQHASLFRGRLDAAHGKKKEPEKWREFFRWKYPECRLPNFFNQLYQTQRDEYHRDFQTFVAAREKEKGPPGWQEFFRWRYGPDVNLPTHFSLLPLEKKQVWEADHADFEAWQFREAQKLAAA